MERSLECYVLSATGDQVAINPVPRPATRWQDPEFHKEYENRATEIIRSSETQNAELCLITPEAMNYTRPVEPVSRGYHQERSGIFWIPAQERERSDSCLSVLCS